MTDYELWQQVQAREELERRGWRLATCVNCNGDGKNPDFDERIHKHGHGPLPLYFCAKCKGRGKLWEEPPK